MTGVSTNTETLIDLFDVGCKIYSDCPAFTCNGETINYQDLEQKSRSFAAYLQNKTDLVPGDRIVIQLINVIEYPVVAWGALRAGLILVNTNPLYTPRELQYQYTDSGAKALIVLAEMFAALEKNIAETDIETIIAVPMAAGCELVERNKGGPIITFSDAIAMGEQLVFRPVTINSDDVALLQYTGGTTGQPKAAMLTHHNLVSSASSLWRTVEILDAGKEIFVSPLPLFHVYAFVGNMVIGISYGVHSILIQDPRNLDEFVKALSRVPFTFFMGINTLFVALCEYEPFKKLDFNHLKFTLSGGMTLNSAVAERWQAVTGSVVYEGYGLTESSAGVIINTPEHYQLGSIGQPMSGVEAKVVDADGRAVAAGERGELYLRSASVMKGYWQRPEETTATLSDDGWLATGDVALIQQDGFIRIVDRIKDVIIVSGFNVYPNEIEAVAGGHEGVLECAAIACAHEKTGEMVKLFVRAKSTDLTEASLRAYCREQLAAYKVPKEIVFVSELPKSSVGKILRRQLR